LITATIIYIIKFNIIVVVLRGLIFTKGGNMDENILITTIPTIPGIQICIKDIVSESVEGLNVEELVEKMKEKAKEKKLDGVLGFRIVSVVEGDKIKLIGYGSGFKIIKSQWAVY